MPAYSRKAQPYLDAIASGFFGSADVRKWLLAGTKIASAYENAQPLIEEQRRVRWASKPTKQPFWANYWCGRRPRCVCRIEGSTGSESDAIFFLRNAGKRTLAIHLEFKHPMEQFGFGQPEAYPLRAECFTQTHRERETLNAHEDWTTVLVAGDETRQNPGLAFFERTIFHSEAVRHLPDWPVE